MSDRLAVSREVLKQHQRTRKTYVAGVGFAYACTVCGMIHAQENEASQCCSDKKE